MKPILTEGDLEGDAMYDDVTLNIIDVGDKRINRLNNRFARYLLAGGRSKPFLISFINAALLFEGDDKIVDLEHIPGEIHGPDVKTKLSILDVSAKLADGHTIDNEEGERMEKVMAEDSVLSMAKDIELSFWADEKERESYFKHQKYLMDLYSDEHTYEVLLRQEREKAEREKKKAAQDALKQGKREMARNLLKLGTGMDIIVQASGLSEEEIRRISE
ncbi:MAG: PD-(D/E)XK nuclease family transposase [Synergistaceae bacterium]|jgi:hypothetical protein|nr:PD-(D/E)XK nuclease family transposase [Synergistaceae bacterium]